MATESSTSETVVSDDPQQQVSIMSMLRADPPPDPLPDGWIMHRSRSQSGYSYYFNQFTGECKWEPPYMAPDLSQLDLKATLASLRNDTAADTDRNSANAKKEAVDDDDANGKVRSILKKSNSSSSAGETPTPTRTSSSSSKSPSSSSKATKRRSHHHHHEGSKRSRTSSDAPEKVRAFHILKKHRDSRRPASWRQAKITISRKEAIEELRELITILQDVASDPKELRATFEELAKTESDCTSAKRGGDLGFFGRKKMQPNFEKASFGLGVGEMSDVVETSSGVHVILRLA